MKLTKQNLKPLTPEELEAEMEELKKAGGFKKVGRFFLPEDFEEVVVEDDPPSKQ